MAADSCHPGRVKMVAYSSAIVYTAGMTGLYQIWYKGHRLTRFHFFDDYDEWYQYDKIGHIGSAYYLSRWGMDLYRWTGMNKKAATWIGGSLGFCFLTTVEVFDGFSDQWGFSFSDFATNIMGSAMAISQQLIWQQQRITFKYSFIPSDYAQYRPDLFGKSFAEQLVKDYNGHTVWISANLSSLTGARHSWMPRWLNLAAGYGIEGLIGARTNPSSINGKPLPPFERYRQFYLAPDVDLSRIQTRRHGLKLLFNLLNFIKLPAPTLEFNRINKIKFHLIYF
jgi:uncharacterized protein YfiM (DUF2279 family)